MTMMKVKVAEAANVQLNWMVAKCEGYHDAMLNVRTGAVFGLVELLEFSTNWSQMGPIIEREGIAVVPLTEEWEAALETLPQYVMKGPTPLVAACRCYVESKLGEVVEVPKELT